MQPSPPFFRQSGPFRIPDTANRAITLDQLELVIKYIQEEVFAAGNVWVRSAGTIANITTSSTSRPASNSNAVISSTTISSIQDVTLYDLNEHFILPQTNAHKCSLVELLTEQEQPPDYFVSHWWGEPIVQFLDCLKQHAHDRQLAREPHVIESYVKGQSLGRSPRYWICAYANNQHDLNSELHPTGGCCCNGNPEKNASLDLSVEDTSFVRAMAKSRGTVLVVDQHATCFQRLWCVYEIYSSLLGNKSQPKLHQDTVKAEHHKSTPLWYLFGEQYTFDTYTAFPHKNLYMQDLMMDRNNQTRKAVGITDGVAAIDSNAELKWYRESYFPVDRLELGICFDCQTARASFSLDKKRILHAIGGQDNQLILNHCVHGFMAASALRRALEEPSKDDNHDDVVAVAGSTMADRFLEAVRNGQLRKLSLFMGGSPADTNESMTRVIQALDPQACQLIDLQSDALRELPDDFGRLENVMYLCLSGCSNLRCLPNSLVRLKSLSSLLLQFCVSLQGLPEIVGELQALTKLSLDGCTLVQRLPESIGDLRQLDRLYLTDMAGLEYVPDSIIHLHKLTVLHLNRCTRLTKLPEGMGKMKSLVDVQLEHCQALTSLPRSMSDLPALQTLNLWHCTGLRMLPRLTQASLTNLETTGVNSKVLKGWEQSGRMSFALSSV